MKKQGIGVFVGTILALLSVLGVMASNIADAMFVGNLQITNNGSSAQNQSVVFTLNTTDFINSGLVNSSLNNTAMRNDSNADAPFMPGLTPNPWAVFVNAISGPNSNVNYNLYTGGNHSMNSTLAYFPGAGGMNTTDSASLEPGANFTINQTARIDTSSGANKNLVYKPGAITTYANAGNITSVLYTANVQTHNYTGTQNSSIYMAVGTGVDQAGQTFNVTYPETVRQVSIFGNEPGNNADVGGSSNCSIFATDINGKPTGSALTWGLFPSFSGSGYYWQDIPVTSVNLTPGRYAIIFIPNAFQAINPPTTRDQSWGANNNTSNLGLSMLSSDSGTTWTTNSTATALFKINGSILPIVTAVVSSGNHTVVTTANTTHYSISIDGVVGQTVSMNGSSVNNTPDNWQFFDANATPYAYRQQILIGGTPQQDISWQYASTFTDASGNGHTAFPTFLTSTASPNLTANLTSFQPVAQSISTPNGSALVAQNITTSFISPPKMFTELNITAPGADFIDSVLNGVGIPRALFWFPFLFGITNLIGLLAAWLTKSILVECAFMGMLLAVLSLMGGFGFWVVIEYIICASAITVYSKQFGF